MAVRLSVRATRPPARRKRRVLKKTAAHTGRLRPEVVALDLFAAPRIVSLALAITCMVVLLYFSFDTQFYIFDLTVDGNQWLEAGEVIQASELEGLHIAWTQPERAARLITSRLPEVRAAHVTCALPARCAIVIAERRPVLLLSRGDIQLGVDAEGIAFAARQAVEGIPLIEMQSGPMPLPGQPADADLLTAAQALRAALPDLQTLRFTSERGLEFLDPRGGWPVYWGKAPDIPARLAVWQALSEDLARKGIRPTFIDVRYARAPYYSTQ